MPLGKLDLPEYRQSSALIRCCQHKDFEHNGAIAKHMDEEA